MVKRNKVITDVAVFILLEVASFCILASGDTIQNAWIGRGLINVQAAFFGEIEKIRSYFNLEDENGRLSEENIALLSRLVNADSTAGGPERNTFRVHYDLMNAKIVTRSRGSQHNYLIVDRGAEDGVEVEDGIITPLGVFGIVTAVSENFCYAVSRENQDIAVSAKVGPHGSVGNLSWNGHSRNDFVLSGIPIHTEVAVGDTVSTSGFSSIFPPDIPIGVVTGKSIQDGSTANFAVRMLEDLENVHNVFIVKNLDRMEIKNLKENAE